MSETWKVRDEGTGGWNNAWKSRGGETVRVRAHVRRHQTEWTGARGRKTFRIVSHRTAIGAGKRDRSK